MAAAIGLCNVRTMHYSKIMIFCLTLIKLLFMEKLITYLLGCQVGEERAQVGHIFFRLAVRSKWAILCNVTIMSAGGQVAHKNPSE